MAELHHTPAASVRQFPTHIHRNINSDEAVKRLLLSIRGKHALLLRKAHEVTADMRADLDPEAYLDGSDIRSLRFYERCFRGAQRLFDLEVAISRFFRRGGAA